MYASNRKEAKEGKEGTISASKKKRVREARRLEARVRAAIEEGRIEEEIKGVKIERVVSPLSTKQAMIARVRFLYYLSLVLTLTASF